LPEGLPVAIITSGRQRDYRMPVVGEFPDETY
jgi:hypothetical protein